jgi:hypothetical protein
VPRASKIKPVVNYAARSCSARLCATFSSEYPSWNPFAAASTNDPTTIEDFAMFSIFIEPKNLTSLIQWRLLLMVHQGCARKPWERSTKTVVRGRRIRTSHLVPNYQGQNSKVLHLVALRNQHTVHSLFQLYRNSAKACVFVRQLLVQGTKEQVHECA